MASEKKTNPAKAKARVKIKDLKTAKDAKGGREGGDPSTSR